MELMILNIFQDIKSKKKWRYEYFFFTNFKFLILTISFLRNFFKFHDSKKKCAFASLKKSVPVNMSFLGGN